MSDNGTTNPVHHHSPSLSGTSLQIPLTQRSQSTISSQRSFDQSKSRASASSFASSQWTSVSEAMSQASGASTKTFYPTSGFPSTNSLPGQTYPSNGYPVSQLQHSYGYPSSNFPCCEIPGVVDMRQQLQYPSSEFPGGGVFPGEVDQEDGSQPFIGATGTDGSRSGVYPSDPLAGAVLNGGFPNGQISYAASSGMMPMPTAFDPHYNLGYPS